MDYQELELEILRWVSRKDNEVSPAISTFHTVRINYGQKINISTISPNCNIEDSEIIRGVTNRKMGIWDYYHSFIDN